MLQSLHYSSLHFHIAAIKIVSVTASLLQYVCLSVVSLFVYLCLFSVLVVGKPARPSLLKKYKGDCCGSSCSVCSVECVRLCAAVSWPCRVDRPSSHGAGSSCVLCCRSGSLSHWSVVGTVSCRKQPQQQPQNSNFSFSFLSLFFFSLSVTNLPPYLSHSQPFMSFFCLPNLLFLLCFSLSYYFHLLSPWPHRPSVSVCIHHLSGWIWLVLVNRAL